MQKNTWWKDNLEGNQYKFVKHFSDCKKQISHNQKHTAPKTCIGLKQDTLLREEKNIQRRHEEHNEEENEALQNKYTFDLQIKHICS